LMTSNDTPEQKKKEQTYFWFNKYKNLVMFDGNSLRHSKINGTKKNKTNLSFIWLF